MSLSESETPVGGDEFRQAMRRLAGGVSVITTGRENDISGMTVTSVSSLSVEPATVIVSINRQASSWPLLQKYRAFGVNILNADQVDIAHQFAGRGNLKGAARFTGAKWVTRHSGVPLLANALAALDCELEEAFERHSHAIVIGRVRDVLLSPRSGGLGYWQGNYIALDDEHDATKLAKVSLPAA